MSSDENDDNVYEEQEGNEDSSAPGEDGEEEYEENLHVDQEDDDDVIIRCNIKRTTSKPCTCCCQMCACWIFLIIVLVALGAVVGGIEFTIGVPFYDRSEINQEREDAYLATERDADFVSTLRQGPTDEKCVHENPTILTRNGTLVQGPAPGLRCQRSSSQFLRLLYVSSDRKSNIITPKNLQRIKEVEDHILQHPQLTRYCFLLNTSYEAFQTRDTDEWQETLVETADDEPITAACERIDSSLNFLDNVYFDITGQETGRGYYLLPNDQIPQEYNFSQSYLDRMISYWSSFGRQRTYDLSNFSAAVATVGDSVTVQNLFWKVTSSEFVSGSTGAIGLTSTYPLGLPINGYVSPSIEKDDQFGDVGQWLWDEFDSYLKDVNIPGVDIYWNDNKNEMSGVEAGALALESFNLFPLSIALVLIYLIIMQDSIFLGIMGIMQILLAFIPTIILYRYIIGQEYIGVLNLISFYIILGIGVDDIFVFTDQYNHFHHEKRLDQRMQKTFNIAAKAMFTTSCTTFISFISNASSVFPAVATFGIFSALLVAVNYCAVITFFPVVYSVYLTRFINRCWDRPSRLYRCKFGSGEPDERTNSGQQKLSQGVVGSSSEENGGNNAGNDAVENDEKVDGEEQQESMEGEKDESGSAIVRFFRDTWAPCTIFLRFPIILIFMGVLAAAAYFTSDLTPDEDAPSTLPDDNPYAQQPDIVIEYFARAGNPSAIEVHWVSGINPDSPIDRSGTQDTDLTDYGTPIFKDCATYNPALPSSQVWSLLTCHDLFFGNVTAYHGNDDSFGPDGTNGPKSRLVATDQVPMDEFSYYRVVSCPMQGFRDWLLTDNGCTSLANNGLQCNNETSQRANCITWDADGDSCEPFPVPSDKYFDILIAFMQDESTNPTTQKSNYDQFSTQIFVDDEFHFDAERVVQDDFSCRTVDGRVLVGMSSTAVLDQEFGQNFEDGIALYEKWDSWSRQMRENAPREMVATMQTSNGAWAFYFLNETLLEETFFSIMLSLILCFVVLTLVGGNIIMAFFSVVTILLIVIDIFAFTVIAGWDLGVIEAVNYVVVIGMSIDYCVHMSEAFTEAPGENRKEKVQEMLGDMGISVLSGALSTLLATFPMFFAPNTFFVKFASFLFTTIALSCIYALTFFPAVLAVMGPLGNTGMVWPFFTRLRKRLVDEFAKRHVNSKEYKSREEENKMRASAMSVQAENGDVVPAPSSSMVYKE